MSDGAIAYSTKVKKDHKRSRSQKDIHNYIGGYCGCPDYTFYPASLGETKPPLFNAFLSKLNVCSHPWFILIAEVI